MHLFMWMEWTFGLQQITMRHEWPWCAFCHNFYYCCHWLSFWCSSEFFFILYIYCQNMIICSVMFSNSSLSLHSLQRKLDANNCNYFHVHSLAVNQESEVKVYHWCSTSRKNYRVKLLLYILLVKWCLLLKFSFGGSTIVCCAYVTT